MNVDKKLINTLILSTSDVKIYVFEKENFKYIKKESLLNTIQKTGKNELKK